MEIERRIHPGWEEYDSLDETIKNKLSFAKHLFGKYQYICTSGDKWISLIYIQTFTGTMEWEIYSRDKLFEDIEKFKTKKEAMVRIKELLK